VDANFLFNLGGGAKRELWILTDEALVDSAWTDEDTPWFIVLAASPQKVKASRQWEKDRNPGMYFVRNWEWHEIVAAFGYYPFSSTCANTPADHNYCE
jgi:hypothetical protein